MGTGTFGRMRTVAALAIVFLLTFSGCVLPDGDRRTPTSITVPPFVIPARLVYSSSGGHEAIITFRDVESADGTFGRIGPAILAQVLHPEADWNHDLQKREVYALDPPRLESIHHRSGVVWENSWEMGRRFVARCDDESFALKMGGTGSHDSDLFVALALAGKTWHQNQQIPLPEGRIVIGINKVPNGTSVTVTYLEENDREGGPIHTARLMYDGSSPYPREIGHRKFVSVTEQAGIAKPFSVPFDSCGMGDPATVAPDDFFADAATAGIAGDALATGASMIQMTPQYRQWAEDESDVRWTAFRVSSSDTNPTGSPSWQVTVDYAQPTGERLQGFVELSEAPARWTPLQIMAGERPQIALAPLPEELARPSTLNYVSWSRGEIAANLEPWTSQIQRHEGGHIVEDDDEFTQRSSVSLIDGGLYWLRGEGLLDGPI